MKVIALIDNDAFYSQCEIARDPERLAGQPVVVVQYNPFGDLTTLPPDADRLRPNSNGGIIAVSYEARKYGVKRNMTGQQAKKICPDLKIVQVPVANGKADLTIYRDAGAAVLNILSKSGVAERASIDEAYVDCTAAAQQLIADARKRAAAGGGGGAGPDGSAAVVVPQPASFEGVHVAGVEPEGPEAVAAWWSRPASEWTHSDMLLAAGSVVIAAARAAVKEALGYTCSAGIAHSKILAKLGSGLHKPAQQTIVPAHAVAGLLAPLPLTKLQKLGGKFGQEVMAALSVTTVGELAAVPLPRLEAALGAQDAIWLSRLAQGIDDDEVKPRMLPKSISCGKTFRAQNVLTGLTAVHTWLLQLGQELQERIEADRAQHQRLPKLLTVSFDSAPLHDTAGGAAGAGAPAAGNGESEGGVNSAAAAAAAGGSSARSNGGGGGGGAAGPSHGRLNAHNWRAGVTNISRSCPLRHVKADAIAQDALLQVKKWARDRPQGFRIVTMFVSASNFFTAPTGASTLDRFFTPAAPAAAAAGRAAAGAAGGSRASAARSEQQQQRPPQQPQPEALPHQQQQQQQLQPPIQAGGGGNSSNSTRMAAAGGLKRRGGVGGVGGRHSKAARTQQGQQRDLRALLDAAAAAAAGDGGSGACPASAAATAAGGGGGSGTRTLQGAAAAVGAAAAAGSGVTCSSGFKQAAEGGAGDAGMRNDGGDTVGRGVLGSHVWLGRDEQHAAAAAAAAVAAGVDGLDAVESDVVVFEESDSDAVFVSESEEDWAGAEISGWVGAQPGSDTAAASAAAAAAITAAQAAASGAAAAPAAAAAAEALISAAGPLQQSVAGQRPAVSPARSALSVLQGMPNLWPPPAGAAAPAAPAPTAPASSSAAPPAAPASAQGGLCGGAAAPLTSTPVVGSLQAWVDHRQAAQGCEAAVATSVKQFEADLAPQHQHQHGQPEAAVGASLPRQQPEAQPFSAHHHQRQQEEATQQQQQQQEATQQQQHVHAQQQQQPQQQQQQHAQPLQLSDVDPEVMAALPWDIQLEVQRQLRGPRTGGANNTTTTNNSNSNRAGRGSSAGRGGAGGAGGRRGGGRGGGRGAGAGGGSGKNKKQQGGTASIASFFAKK